MATSNKEEAILKQVNILSKNPLGFSIIAIVATLVFSIFFILYSFMKVFLGQKEIANINKNSMEIIRETSQFVIKSEQRIIESMFKLNERNIILIKEVSMMLKKNSEDLDDTKSEILRKLRSKAKTLERIEEKLK